jgi:hypothetical protein
VALPDGHHLLDSGTASGVQWFVSQAQDPQMGECRTVDFKQTGARSSATPSEPLFLGLRNAQCSSAPLTTSLDESTGTTPLIVLAADALQVPGFSTVVAITAPGVETVEMLDDGHVGRVIHPDAAHVAVSIDHPPRPTPTAVVVIWHGAHSYCVAEAGGYRCEGPTPDSVRVLRVANTRYGPAELECGTRSVPCDEGSAIEFPQCSDALGKYFDARDFAHLDQRVRALVGAPPSGNAWRTYGCGRTDSLPTP